MPVVQIITCSVRENRLGGAIATWVEELARARGDLEIEGIDLRAVALPMFSEPRHPRLARYEFAHTLAWSATVSRADGFVFVTPEYNHSFPASLKNAIDYLHNEWKYKPVAFVSYGGVAAGTRAVQSLKPVLAALQMPPVLEAVAIPAVQKLFDAEKHFNPPSGLDEAARLMLERLAFWTHRQLPLHRS